MTLIRKNGRPGVVEIESWFAVVLAIIAVLGFGFGVLRGAILDNKCLKDTEARTLEQAKAIDAVETDVIQLKAVLPIMQTDIADIKQILMARSRGRD